LLGLKLQTIKWQMNFKLLSKLINKLSRNLRYSLYIKYLLFNKKKIIDNNNLSPIDNRLTTLMNNFYSDKGDLNNQHNYTKFYHSLFEKISHNNLKVFEVGIGSINTNITFHMKYSNENYKPLASLKAWEEYFPNSEIYGADIDKEIIQSVNRIKTYYVDMTKKETIIKMWKSINNKMDIIIDDGFHNYEANINFFNYSYEMLKENGYYIIEDIHRKPSNIKKFVNFFKEIKINYQIIDLPHKNNISDNCLILIQKK